jgi:hypothetical protein
VAAVAGEVVAVVCGEVGGDEAVVVVPEVGSAPGGRGSFTTIAPSTPAGTGSPEASRTRTSQPGSGRVGDPGLRGAASMPTGLATMGQPVLVCHKWSITGMPRRVLAQW